MTTVPVGSVQAPLPFATDPDITLWVPLPRDEQSGSGRAMASRDLRRLGSLVLRSWRRGQSPRFDLLRRGDILVTAAAHMNDCSIDEAAALIASQFEELGDITEQTRRWLLRESAHLFERLRLAGVASLADMTPADALAFIEEPYQKRSGVWAEPAGSTQSTRRTAIRLVFQAARHLHLASGDPTQDIEIDRSGGSTAARALTDAEELLGRSASRDSLDDTRHPAGWALGQATGTSGEIGVVRVSDLRLQDHEVLLPGHRRRRARVGQLTEWGVQKLHDRVEALDGRPDARLITGNASEGESTQAYSCGVIFTVLQRALLSGEPGIEPNSLASWAGRRAFEATGQIADAAEVLGVRSLDRAAALIGWDWQ